MLAGNCRIIGYLAIWKWEERNWSLSAVDGEKLTDINLSFAHIKENGEIFIEDYDSEKLKKFFTSVGNLKKTYPHLRVNISIGGWGGEGFSDTAYYPEKRHTFVKSVIEWLEKYDLDGVDIDWEYPVDGGGGTIKSRPQDRENFTLLLKDLKAALGELSSKTGKKYTLSFAAGAFEEYLSWIQPGKLASIVDFVNLMTYDFYGSWTPVTGHHANLRRSRYQPDNQSVERAVNLFLRAGFPPKKIILGVPFFGRGWRGVSSQNNGLYQPYDEAISEDIDRRRVKQLLKGDNMRKYWDKSAEASFMYDGDLWISYESPRSLRLKISFVKKRKLSGIMFWEYFLDPDGELLDIIFNGLCSPGQALKRRFKNLNHPR